MVDIFRTGGTVAPRADRLRVGVGFLGDDRDPIAHGDADREESVGAEYGIPVRVRDPHGVRAQFDDRELLDNVH